MHFNPEVKPLISRTINLTFALCVLLSISAVALCAQTQSRIRVAVLDFGESGTGVRAAEKVREALTIDKVAGFRVW
jgi:hypothetical protein